MNYPKRFLKCCFKALIIFFSVCLFFHPNAKAQKIIYTEDFKLSLGGSLIVGAGLTDYNLFATEDDTATLSPGGGIGMDLTLGFFISPRLEIDINTAYQNSILSEKLKNADANFSKFYVNTSIKWIIFGRKDYRAWKVGGGLGYYIPTGMKIEWEDMSNLPDGELTIDYKSSFGYHIIGEWERYFDASKWSFSISLSYCYVSYEASSASAKNIEIVDLGEFETVDGSAINFGFIVKKYF